MGYMGLSFPCFLAGGGLRAQPMSELSNLREKLPGILKALAVGIPMGALFDWLDTPLPWMIGPMLAIGGLNLMGQTLLHFPYGRQVGQAVVGSAVALYFTPAVLAALLAHLGAIVAATLCAFLIGGIGAVILMRASGVDGKTSFFASIPGGAMEMSVLADRCGASVPAVALAHSLRVTIVVIVVPFFLTYAGFSGNDLATRPAFILDHARLWPWMAAALALGWLGGKIRVQNSFLLMPIFVGGALVLNGVQLSAIPSWLIDVAQLAFGLTLGARFEREFFLRYKLFLPFALLNTFIVIIASAALGFVIAWVSGIPLATVLTGTAPGGFAEMTITAEVLQLGVPLVVAFHLLRVVLVNIGTQYVYAGAEWARARFAPRSDRRQ
jgi:membrane AbrB-like protein